MNKRKTPADIKNAEIQIKNLRKLIMILEIIQLIFLYSNLEMMNFIFQMNIKENIFGRKMIKQDL